MQVFIVVNADTNYQLPLGQFIYNELAMMQEHWIVLIAHSLINIVECICLCILILGTWFKHWSSSNNTTPSVLVHCTICLCWTWSMQRWMRQTAVSIKLSFFLIFSNPIEFYCFVLWICVRVSVHIKIFNFFLLTANEGIFFPEQTSTIGASRENVLANYVAYNNVPMGTTHFKGRLFVTVPR